MKCFGYGLLVVAISLMAHFASANEYVVFGGYWQEEAAPADAAPQDAPATEEATEESTEAAPPATEAAEGEINQEPALEQPSDESLPPELPSEDTDVAPEQDPATDEDPIMDGEMSPEQSPEQAPAELKGMGPSNGCGCGNDWSDCGSYDNCCSGWWSGYCRTRHGCRHAGHGCGRHRGFHRHHGRGCHGSYTVIESSCGCGGEWLDGAVEGKGDDMVPPAPTPADETEDRSAYNYGRIIRW